MTLLIKQVALQINRIKAPQIIETKTINELTHLECKFVSGASGGAKSGEGKDPEQQDDGTKSV